MWAEDVRKALQDFGCTQSGYDQCCYYLMVYQELVVLLHHVDDLLILGQKGSLLSKVIEYLCSRYRVPDLRDADCFLSIKIQ